MKKKIIKIAIPVIIIVAIVAVVMNFIGGRAVYVEDADAGAVKAAFKLLSESYLEEGEEAEVYYVDFIKDNNYEPGNGRFISTLIGGTTANVFATENKDNENVPDDIGNYSNNVKALAYKDVAQYNVSVGKAGLYYIELDFISAGSSLSDFTISVNINGKQAFQEMDTILLPINWKDSKEFPVDRYGDEMAPTPERIQRWRTQPLYNNTYASTTPLCFYFEAGENVIEVQNVSSEGLVVGSLALEEAKDNVPTYEEYAKDYKDQELVKGAEIIPINAIDYTQKNSTQAVYGSEANASLTPFDIDNDKLNTISWKDAGTSITYSFDVKETGMYNIALHYSNGKEEFDAFETIMIDGVVPFKELYNYQFDPVNAGWENEVLSDKDGNPYKFSLSSGPHTITIKSEISPVMEAYRYALLIQKHVTDFQLEITKITGAEVDADRAWKMRKYIPEIEEYLNAYTVLIQHMRYIVQEYAVGGSNSSITAYLDKADVYIEELLEYPDEIALHVDDLTGADNSILQAMSAFGTELYKDDFSLDMIYVYGDEELPAADQSVFESAWIGTKQLLDTFVSDKYSTSVDEEDKDSLTIWVNKAVTYVDLLQKMADTQFTAETGIKVKVMPMPDVNKIIMASAAGETPDVALGLGSHIPFDLSCRGILYDMTNFDDFWNVAGRFPSGSFVSYVYNEGVYAIPETTDFNVIIYRTDILDSLNIKEIPNTWDELVDILPTLQRYGMNFYHNIGIADVSYKWFYQTAPMMLQNGGELYAEDGLSAAVNSKKAVKGMQILGDLFTKYSLPESTGAFFNAFRYAELPIGIAAVGDYTLIKNAAPELSGKWALAPYIGTEQADGTINRTFIANGTGGVIFGDGENTEPNEKQKQAWEFLKWWTSTSVQTEYAHTLVSTYGKTYFWLTANLEALQNVPMEEADKQVILEQIEWVTDVPRTPGQYLLERTISTVWNNVVFDGVSAQVAMDESLLDVNKEITRKMQEFGYLDEHGNKLKQYTIRDKDWIEEQQQKAIAEGGIQ